MEKRIIETIYGPMDEQHLLKGKKTGGFDNENEICEWVEYWIEGVLVHRSVKTHLKKGLFGLGQSINFK